MIHSANSERRLCGRGFSTVTSLLLFRGQITEACLFAKRRRMGHEIPFASSVLSMHDFWLEIRHRTSNLHRLRETFYDRASPWIDVMVERLRIALDCVLTVWFIMGNAWMFDGGSSSDTSNLCRFFILFLTFCCMSCAMPFVLCTTLCCCVPCLVRVLRLQEDDPDERGASEEAIAALPVYKFTISVSDEPKRAKEGTQSNSEVCRKGSFGGTEDERGIPTEDAVCCICLGKYTEGVALRELPCSHKFHMGCVDRWLRISADCPLCKHEISAPKILSEIDELLMCW